MRNSLSLRNKLILALVLTGLIAQSAVPLANHRVREVGELLACQCGCNYSVSSCNMQQCHFADPARLELLALVESGKGEKEILDIFEAKYGKKVLRRPPTEGFYLTGWVMPFVGLGAGLVVIWVVLKRVLQKQQLQEATANAAPPEAARANPDLDRYRSQIEKETEDLE